MIEYVSAKGAKYYALLVIFLGGGGGKADWALRREEVGFAGEQG